MAVPATGSNSGEMRFGSDFGSASCGMFGIANSANLLRLFSGPATTVPRSPSDFASYRGTDRTHHARLSHRRQDRGHAVLAGCALLATTCQQQLDKRIDNPRHRVAEGRGGRCRPAGHCGPDTQSASGPGPGEQDADLPDSGSRANAVDAGGQRRSVAAVSAASKAACLKFSTYPQGTIWLLAIEK
jgi:hypothetical protein